MIHLTPADTALAIFALPTALIVPLPAFFASSRTKNAGFWMFSFILTTEVLVVFCDNIIVRPLDKWCVFVQRYMTISSIGTLASLVVMMRRIVACLKEAEESVTEAKVAYSGGVGGVVLDVLIVGVAAVVGMVTQAFGQRDPVPYDPIDLADLADDAYAFAASSLADVCFPYTPDPTLGIVFTDVPHLLLAAIAFVYALVAFNSTRTRSSFFQKPSSPAPPLTMPTPTLLLLVTSVLTFLAVAYFLPLFILRPIKSLSPSVIETYEHHRPWLLVALGICWAVIWIGGAHEARIWYTNVWRGLNKLGRRVSGPGKTGNAGRTWTWRPSLPPMPSLPRPFIPSLPFRAKPDNDEKIDTIGLHTHGTILRPSRKTWLSQYERVSIRDVGGLLSSSSSLPELPLPTFDKAGASGVHPSMVFPGPPSPKGKKKSKKAANTFSVSLPQPIPKTEAEAYAMHVVPSYTPPSSSHSQYSPSTSSSCHTDAHPISPPKATTLPVAPVPVNYPFATDERSFLEMAKTKEEKPLVSKR